MSRGLPGLAGTDHVGFTVPDLDAATAFFVDVIGCDVVFEIGPFVAEDDWMEVHLGVHPRAVIRKLRMLRCKNGPAFELFEYEMDGAAAAPPANSDVGAAHLGFLVSDMEAAVAHLRRHGVEVQGRPTTMTEGPSEGLTWVYFRAPWGMQLELVSYPQGMAVTRSNPGVLWSPRESQTSGPALHGGGAVSGDEARAGQGHRDLARCRPAERRLGTLPR